MSLSTRKIAARRSDRFIILSDDLGPILSLDERLPSVGLDTLGQDLLGRSDILSAVVCRMDVKENLGFSRAR